MRCWISSEPWRWRRRTSSRSRRRRTRWPMASRGAVTAALKLLSRAFSGDVDPARAETYAAALEDLSDDELARATTIVIKTYLGAFIPPPAVIIDAVKPIRATVDSTAIIS